MFRRLFSSCIVFCILIFCCAGGAAAAGQEVSRMFFAMDTVMSVRIPGGSEELLSEIVRRVESIEQQVSVTREESELYHLNHTGSTKASKDTFTIAEKALSYCEETDGALDISVYPIVREWGFTTGSYHVPEQEVLDRLLEKVDYRRVELGGSSITIPDGMAIDFGSVTKGYTGDVIAQMIRDAGIRSAIMDLGGNVHTVGKKTDGSFWRIAVRSPEGDGLVGVLQVADEAVITSGGYERFFEDEDGNIWWHIIDPATGYPARSGLISVTIVGPEGIRCDALSTSLFVMGEERAVSFWREHGDFDMILITSGGELLLTPGLEDRFTPDSSLKYTVRVIR